MSSIKQIMISILISISSIFSFSQEYPSIEIDKSGNKVIIFTIDQGQRIDNDLERYSILSKMFSKCDSLAIFNYKESDALGQKISIQETTIEELNKQLVEKGRQIVILRGQNSNQRESILLLEEQKNIKSEQINLLNDDIAKESRNKWIFGSAGIIIGLLFSIVK
jgi:hypothetical protein